MPAPTQSNIQASLRSFLTAVLPSIGPDGLPLDVIAAQQNRIPTPRGSSYVIMTLLRMDRLETNVDSYQDSKFTGSINGTTMTVTAFDPVLSGPLAVGSPISGVGVAPGTQVTAIVTGEGGVGSYKVSPKQSFTSRTLSGGVERVQQALKCAIQLDFHSSDYSAGDMANTVSTLFRDEFAVYQFSNQIPDYGVRPLYADDAKQLPFQNDQQQIEWRWVVEALLQANVVVTVAQQYADAVVLTLLDVEAIEPAPPPGSILTTDLTKPGNEIVVPLILTGV